MAKSFYTFLIILTLTFATATRNGHSSCGGVLRDSEGEISYKPDEQVAPNERCVWTVAAPNAIHQAVNVTLIGFPAEQQLLSISGFRYTAPEPTHYAPVNPQEIELFQITMFIVTFHTPNVTDGIKGFSLTYQKTANATGDLPERRHEIVSPTTPYLRHPEGERNYDDNDQAAFVFPPLNNIYLEGDERILIYNKLGMEASCLDRVVVFEFEPTPTKAWTVRETLCGDGSNTVLFRTDDVLLLVFQSDPSISGSGFEIFLPQT